MDKLIYPSVGVLDRQDGFSDLKPILLATQPAEDVISLKYRDGTSEDVTIDPKSVKQGDNGLTSYKTEDGDIHIIRPIIESDGRWISAYKAEVAPASLRGVLMNREGNKSMPYLEDENERMVAFQLPDDEYIFGVLYINRFGAYMRMNGAWVQVSPQDATFDDTYPYYVNKDTVDEFLKEFDKGLVKYNDVASFLTDPED